MTPQRSVSTDEILVEFEGDLRETTISLGRIVRGFPKTYPPEDSPWWDTAEALEEYLSLVDRLNALAPEGYYFGGHPMQPQCLGYWPTP